MFMVDNALLHRTAEVSDTLEYEHIVGMIRPVNCPDLNLIQHAWNAIGRRLSERTRFY